MKTKTTTIVSVVYTSIGREILTGTLSAFQSSLLYVYATSKEDNIGMSSNLAVKIYRNTPVLCDTFWDDWNKYCHTRTADATVAR